MFILTHFSLTISLKTTSFFFPSSLHPHLTHSFTHHKPKTLFILLLTQTIKPRLYSSPQHKTNTITEHLSSITTVENSHSLPSIHYPHHLTPQRKSTLNLDFSLLITASTPQLVSFLTLTQKKTFALYDIILLPRLTQNNHSTPFILPCSTKQTLHTSNCAIPCITLYSIRDSTPLKQPSRYGHHP